jgi:hypothetical protein
MKELKQLDLFECPKKDAEEALYAVRSLNYVEIKKEGRLVGFSKETVWKTTKGRMTKKEANDYIKFKEDCDRGYAGEAEIIKIY